MLTRPYYEYPSVNVVINVVRGWSLIVLIKILPPALIHACTNSSQRKIELTRLTVGRVKPYLDLHKSKCP